MIITKNLKPLHNGLRTISDSKQKIDDMDTDMGFIC